jgi:hypothetical protein
MIFFHFWCFLSITLSSFIMLHWSSTWPDH